MGDNLLTATLGTARERAQVTVRKHAEILAKMTPEVMASDDSLDLVRGQFSALAREYIQEELAIFGVDAPLYLDRTNPEHAIVLAVWTDILNSSRDIDVLLQQNASARLWEKQPQTVLEAFGVGVGISAEKIREGIDNAGSAIRDFFSSTIGIVSIVLTAIGLMVGLLFLLKD